MDLLGIDTANLIGTRKINGVTADKDDLILDPQLLFPAPQIQGQVTNVQIEPGAIRLLFGDHQTEPNSSRCGGHNFMAFRGGSVRFGKLTMDDSDLEWQHACRPKIYMVDCPGHDHLRQPGCARARQSCVTCGINAIGDQIGQLVSREVDDAGNLSRRCKPLKRPAANARSMKLDHLVALGLEPLAHVIDASCRAAERGDRDKWRMGDFGFPPLRPSPCLRLSKFRCGGRNHARMSIAAARNADSSLFRCDRPACAGQDLWPYRGLQPLNGPTPMGHEYCSFVEEVGSTVKFIKPGRHELAVHARRLVAVPAVRADYPHLSGVSRR